MKLGTSEPLQRHEAPRRVRSADCKIHVELERNSQFIGRGQEKSKKAVYVQSHFLTGFDVPDPVSCGRLGK